MLIRSFLTCVSPLICKRVFLVYLIQHCLFHCVDGCWDRTQDCCNCGAGSQTLCNSAISHPHSARSQLHSARSYLILSSVINTHLRTLLMWYGYNSIKLNSNPRIKLRSTLLRIINSAASVIILSLEMPATLATSSTDRCQH
jgi:hypothetical protein